MAFTHLSISPFLSFPNPSLSSHKTLNPKPKSILSKPFASIIKLSEAEQIPIAKEPAKLDERIPLRAGVYGVYDSTGDLQFVGTSENVYMSVCKHRRWVSELCDSVKVGPLIHKGPNLSLLTPTSPHAQQLKSAWQLWIGEYASKTGKIPLGNLSQAKSWAVVPPKLCLARNVTNEPIETVVERALRVHEAVVFIHGPIKKVLKAPDLEYASSVRLVGLLLRHGADFVKVDLLDEEGNKGVRKALEGMFEVKEVPLLFVRGENMGGEREVVELVGRGKLHEILLD